MADYMDTHPYSIQFQYISVISDHQKYDAFEDNRFLNYRLSSNASVMGRVHTNVYGITDSCPRWLRKVLWVDTG